MSHEAHRGQPHLEEPMLDPTLASLVTTMRSDSVGGIFVGLCSNDNISPHEHRLNRANVCAKSDVSIGY